MALNSFAGHRFEAVPPSSPDDDAGGDAEYAVTTVVGRADYAFGLPGTGSEAAVRPKKKLEDLTAEELAVAKRAETVQNDRLLRSFGTTCPVKFRNLSNKTVRLAGPLARTRR